MSIVRTIFTVSGLTAISRVLGLVREMLQSRLIGAGVEQSAFVLAFAIPNMARKLFGEGALTAAFVPIFKAEVERGELESARHLARAVMTMVMLMLGAIVLMTVIGLSVWLNLGDGLSERMRLTLRLIRILFPYMLFICGAAFGMGVLNALGRFVEGALMPAMLNVLWIGILAALSFFPGITIANRIIAVCFAILFGGVAQMAFLFSCMSRRGFSPKPIFTGLLDANARLVWRNTFVAAIGAGAIQINYMLDQLLAQCAAPWAAGVIGYAERLMDLPLGVIGVAFGTVLLPTFAGFFARDDIEGARKSLGESIVHLMFGMLPAAAGLFILAPEITAVIYEGNAFDATATTRVSRALAVYALGLGFFGYQKSMIPWFQAQNDMKTPLKISLMTVLVNAILNILAVCLLPVEWRHVGLAGSTVVCAAIGCAWLTVLARRKNGTLGLGRSMISISKILFASIAMAIVVYLARSSLPEIGKLAKLAVLIAIGISAYGILALCFRLRFRRDCSTITPS